MRQPPYCVMASPAARVGQKPTSRSAMSAKIAASPPCDKLYFAPGNAGIAAVAVCVPIAAVDIGQLVRFAKNTSIDFDVVGPEAPLVAALVVSAL